VKCLFLFKYIYYVLLVVTYSMFKMSFIATNIYIITNGGSNFIYYLTAQLVGRVPAAGLSTYKCSHAIANRAFTSFKSI